MGFESKGQTSLSKDLDAKDGVSLSTNTDQTRKEGVLDRELPVHSEASGKLINAINSKKDQESNHQSNFEEFDGMLLF